MLRYHICGATMESAYPFASPLLASTDVPDVRFVCARQAPDWVDWEAKEVIDEQGRGPEGEPIFAFYRLGSHDCVRITGAVDFHVRDDQIACHLLDERHDYLVEIALFGMVLSLWLERKGTPTLHGSAVTMNGRAVGFLGSKGAGKTSLAASFVAAGYPLLTDDLLAIDMERDRFLARRAVPAFRLWPDQVHRFVGDHLHFPTFHPGHDKRRVPVGPDGFGRFAQADAPLSRLYVLERHTDPDREVAVTNLGTPESLMMLIRYSFLPREVHRYGLQARRLRALAHLLEQVPVAHLRYPDDFRELERVISAVEADVSTN